MNNQTSLGALLISLALSTACQAAPDLEQRIRDAVNSPQSVTVKVGGADIRLRIGEGQLALPRSALVAWVQSDATAVATYYGEFPVAQVGVFLTPAQGEGVSQGVTFGDGMPVMRVGVGANADSEVLAKDWVLVHEMVHLAFPLMPRRHHWMEEGIATYVEPIARAQAGQLSDAKVWGDMLLNLHNGLPAEGDQGLDVTHTWGRTYWGGAMFCLLADVRLREATANRFGLQDALKAINHESGGMRNAWPLLKALQVGDAATGTQVLQTLYGEMATKPVTPDLPALWRDLGVVLEDGRILFDDKARLAEVRKAITRRPAA